MLEAIWTGIEHALGADAEAVTWWQLGLRTLIAYGVGLGLVRIGKRRFMGTYSSFDVIIGITVGALLASAVNDASMFLHAIVIALGLVALHWVLATATYYSDAVEHALIGRKEPIVEDGELQEEGMRRTRISTSDLEQALRMAGLEDLEKVKTVFLERNGNLSIVPYADEEADEADGEEANRDDARGDDDDGARDERTRNERTNGEARRDALPGDGRPAPRVIAVDVQDGVQRVVVELR